MIAYWALFSLPAFAMLFSNNRLSLCRYYVSVFFWLFFSLFIGLRSEVGGDWFRYSEKVIYHRDLHFFDVVWGADPGYYILNYLFSNFDSGIYLVNIFCAGLVVAGVLSFSRRQPFPWVALVVSVPYLLIVIAMGYTRQSVALGFLLIGLASLSEQKVGWFVFWVILGALFHKSVVIMLPVAALSLYGNKYLRVFLVGVVSVLAAYFFVLQSSDDLWRSYVGGDYESEGGLIRVLMNVVPAVIYIALYKKFRRLGSGQPLWLLLSFAAVACVPLVLVASTATDRAALYLIPLQLYVFSHLPILVSGILARSLLVVGIVLYYATVLFVWLNFASHAHAWLPYQMYPFAS